jgi:hypothetical protein
MVKKYTKIFHTKILQNLPKLGIWFENKPSGNPDRERQQKELRRSAPCPAGVPSVPLSYGVKPRCPDTCKQGCQIFMAQHTKMGKYTQ